MASIRPPLRGGCHCGRNRYIVQVPPDAVDSARVLFDTHPAHRSSLASPIPAFLRVPLDWYHSSTRPFFPDETPAMIHRVYEPLAIAVSPSPPAATAQRHFCGFCGTPLSYWSEAPRSEAAFIRLALGSLYADDLEELDEWVGDESEASSEAGGGSGSSGDVDVSSTGLPWLDSFVEGSRLGRQLQRQRQRQQHLLVQQQQQQQQSETPNVTREVGSAQSADGTVQVEWEVVEWTEGMDDENTDADDGEDKEAAAADTKAKDGANSDARTVPIEGRPSPAKRPKRSDPEGGV